MLDVGADSMLAVRFGLALTGRSLETRREGCIWVREGVIESVEGSSSCPKDYVGSPAFIAIPQPANAHVHSADYAFPEYGVEKKLQQLVEYPNGEKHKRLQTLSREKLVLYTRKYYELAYMMGLGLLADFRELGGLGCRTGKNASENIRGMDIIHLGRPGPMWPEYCDGVGISSPLDYDIETLRELTSFFPIAATHVAETKEARLRGDLEKAV
jgi:hypothetical protein